MPETVHTQSTIQVIVEAAREAGTPLVNNPLWIILSFVSPCKGERGKELYGGPAMAAACNDTRTADVEFPVALSLVSLCTGEFSAPPHPPHPPAQATYSPSFTLYLLVFI